MHVQSFVDLLRIFQGDSQHALSVLFEWHNLCKVFWDAWVILFLFFWSFSVQTIVRSLIPWQYLLGAHESWDTASSFSGVVPVRGWPKPFCLSMVPNASNLFIRHFTWVLSWCFSGLSFHILYAVYCFSW